MKNVGIYFHCKIKKENTDYMLFVIFFKYFALYIASAQCWQHVNVCAALPHINILYNGRSRTTDLF